jgi:hypothetical protein
MWSPSTVRSKPSFSVWGRAAAVTAVLAAVAVLATCGGPTSRELPVPGRPVETSESVPDGGAEDGGEDGGTDGGLRVEGFIVRAFEVLSRETFHQGGQVTGLSESGIVSGYSYLALDRAQSWIVLPPEGAIEAWDWAQKKPNPVLSLQADGTYCGGAPWPLPEVPATSGTAIIGKGSTAERLLPDPVPSSCYGRNDHGVTIGSWKGGFIRWPDGKMVSMNFFPRPDKEGEFIYARGRGINARTEVVGVMDWGEPFGAGSPAGFYWSEQRGALVLKSHGRGATAVAINDHGVIVGGSTDSQGVDVVAVWDTPDAQPRYLPTPDGWYLIRPGDINNAGLIVGHGYDEQSVRRGLVWWKDLVYLGDELVGDQLPSSADRFVVDRLDFVNDQGRIAGITREDSMVNGEHVVRWSPIVIDVLQVP